MYIKTPFELQSEDDFINKPKHVANMIFQLSFNYISDNKSYVVRMGEGRGVHRVLVGKPEGKRPLGKPRRRWKDNIRMDLQEVGGGYGTGWSWLRIGTSGGHL